MPKIIKNVNVLIRSHQGTADSLVCLSHCRSDFFYSTGLLAAFNH